MSSLNQNNVLPKGIMFDLDDTITTFNSIVVPTWKEVCQIYANRYDMLEKEELFKNIRETADWFWSDKKRHKEGRLNIEITRREILEITFKKMEIDNNSLAHESSLDLFIPLNPRKVGSKHRLDFIYEKITDSFGLNKHDKFKNLVCTLGHNWAWGQKMSTMVLNQVKYRLEVSPARSITSIIREYLGTLENEIRYKLVKYISAYIDILTLVLKERGMNELSEKIEPYHIYLEFGSCNKHSLNLMALGLSRFSALHLEKQFSNIQEFNADVTPEMYIERIKKMKIPLLNLPEVCRKEVMELVGIESL